MLNHNLKGLHAVLFSKTHYENNMYPFHLEKIEETIEANLKNNFMLDSGENLDWHLIGLFNTPEEAAEYVKKLDEKYKILNDDIKSL